MDDKAIVDLFFARNEEAIVQSDIKYGCYCRTISFNILNNHQDAEECTNDTYLQVWNTIPPTKPACLKAYLGRIARNISLNVFRSKQTQKRKADTFSAAYEELENLLQSDQSLDECIDNIILSDLIEKFLKKQARKNRMIFIARYWYFESIHEIANKLCISESKTKMSLLRMRNALKEFLTKEGVMI